MEDKKSPNPEKEEKEVTRRSILSTALGGGLAALLGTKWRQQQPKQALETLSQIHTQNSSTVTESSKPAGGNNATGNEVQIPSIKPEETITNTTSQVDEVVETSADYPPQNEIKHTPMKPEGSNESTPLVMSPEQDTLVKNDLIAMMSAIKDLCTSGAIEKNEMLKEIQKAIDDKEYRMKAFTPPRGSFEKGIPSVASLNNQAQWDDAYFILTPYYDREADPKTGEQKLNYSLGGRMGGSFSVEINKKDGKIVSQSITARLNKDYTIFNEPEFFNPPALSIEGQEALFKSFFRLPNESAVQWKEAVDKSLDAKITDKNQDYNLHIDAPGYMTYTVSSPANS